MMELFRHLAGEPGRPSATEATDASIIFRDYRMLFPADLGALAAGCGIERDDRTASVESVEPHEDAPHRMVPDTNIFPLGDNRLSKMHESIVYRLNDG